MKFLVLLLPVLAYSQTYELEKIVFGSKRQISEDDYTGDVESITDFSSAGNEKVLDELQQLPGVIINQQGTPGQQASIYIRGSQTRHVLVLIDGVRVNDPSNTDKFFNGALLNVGDIEKVEVLNGSQSLLYGSEAIGGVVNIITKKGSSKNSISLYSGWAEGIELDNTWAGKDSVFHSHLFYEQSDGNGVSAAASGDEADGFTNKGATLNFSKQLTSKLEGVWTYKVWDQFTETDTLDSSSVPIDADNDYAKSIQQVFSQELNYKTGDSELSYLLGGNWMDRANKSSSSFDPDGTVYDFDAKEFTNEIHWKKKEKNGSWLLGVENLSEYASSAQNNISEKFAGITSLLLIRDQEKGSHFWNYGLRGSYHTQFGEAFSPGFGFGKRFGANSLALNYQQGFRSPSLIQLYGPESWGSDPDLDPETSEYVDLVYRYGKVFEASVFFNHIDDYIDYGDDFKLRNTFFMETYGVEAQANFSYGKNTVTPGIYLAHYHMANGEEVLRRPSQKATLSFKRDFSASQSLVLDYVWKGRRFDKVGAELVELAPYDLFDLHYELTKNNLQYHVGVENLFGENYEEVKGFSSQPFTAYLKVKYFY